MVPLIYLFFYILILEEPEALANLLFAAGRTGVGQCQSAFGPYPPTRRSPASGMSSISTSVAPNDRLAAADQVRT